MQKTKDDPVPRNGCGTDLGITGCRFSLSVMSDDYANRILDAIGRVDTRKVWSGTDALSTIYRGKRVQVLDAVGACLAHVNDGRTHVTMEATFSRGCPGDSAADSYLAEDDEPANADAIRADGNSPVLGKISFYPMGEPRYMDHIAQVVDLTKGRGVFSGVSHYATELRGGLSDILDCIGEIMAHAEGRVAHYVLQATFSMNSPSLADRG